jgi:hypothetical protein
LVGDIVKRGDNNHVNCPNCPNYFDGFEKKSVISVRMGGQSMKVDEAKPSPVICPFIDPIETGIYDPCKVSGFKEIKEIKEEAIEADRAVEAVVTGAVEVVKDAEDGAGDDAEAEDGADDEIRKLIGEIGMEVIDG